MAEARHPDREHRGRRPQRLELVAALEELHQFIGFNPDVDVDALSPEYEILSTWKYSLGAEYVFFDVKSLFGEASSPPGSIHAVHEQPADPLPWSNQVDV